MNALKRISTCVLAGILVVIVQPVHGLAQQNPEASKNILQPVERDGQHDFDFEIGTWITHLRRLVTGSTPWVEYEGTSVVRKVWNGRANLVRFTISDITPNSCRFEQAFSEDGGKTWEVNWIATDTRVKDEFDEAH